METKECNHQVTITQTVLKYFCSWCGYRIKVRGARAFDAAECPCCRKLQTVPAEAIETDEAPDQTVLWRLVYRRAGFTFPTRLK